MNLFSTWLRADAGASISALPVDEHFWPRLMNGEHGSFSQAYLVSAMPMADDWNQWERHPAGDELVCLLDGEVDVIVESAAGDEVHELRVPGDFVVLPAGAWHTADVRKAGHALFMTPGEGSEHRPRS